MSSAFFKSSGQDLENIQNGGCKPKNVAVFASVSRFGETKFKPIRKQENISVKSAQPTKKARVDTPPAPSPVKRVNKFFKSRNVGSVSTSQEPTVKPKPVITTPVAPTRPGPGRPRLQSTELKSITTNIRPIKVAPSSGEKASRPRGRPPKNSYELQKPKSQIASEKVSPVKERITPKVISNQSNTRRSKRNVSFDVTEDDEPVKEIKEEQSYSDTKRYSTRYSKRSSTDSDESKSTSAIGVMPLMTPVDSLSLDEITLKEEKSSDFFLLKENLGEIDQIEMEPFVSSEPFIPAKLPEVVKRPRGRPPKSQTLVTKTKNELEKNEPEEQNAEKLFSNVYPTSKTEDDNLDIHDQEKIVDQNQLKAEVEVETESETDLKNVCETKNVSPEPDIEMSPVESKVESVPLIEEEVKVTLPQEPSTSSNNKSAVPVPAKKRFFSRSSKDKKQVAQFNTKNFFANKNEEDSLADEFGMEEAPGDSKKEPEVNTDYDYLKLKKVRKAHQCAELGETEHFDGEIMFYLSGIKEKNTISMRCLSILGLANQCLNKPELRMHLRAHDYMFKIIRALMDAPKNSNLALCTAALMFVYNQDRLTMDIDPNALSLMLELLECGSDETSDQIEKKHKEKITEMCKTMKEKGYGKYLNLFEITAGTLSLETLLGLTSKRAGDWFKEELRRLNGIDFLLNTILNVFSDQDKEFAPDEGELNKIDRSLRVIENVTFLNSENQQYVIAYRDHHFVAHCIKLFEYCKDSIVYSESLSQSGSYLSPLLSVLRVMTNLTTNLGEGVIEFGERFPEFLPMLIDCIFELPSFVVSDSRFDLIILLLCLCINLVELCSKTREEFVENSSQLRRLISMLSERVAEAVETEQQADEFLDSHEQKQMNSETINIDSILTNLLARSGKHMEHTIVAACISLLIGTSIKDSQSKMHQVKQLLPNCSFDIMIEVITKLKEFSNLACIMTESGIRRVDCILSVLKGDDKKPTASKYADMSVSLMSIKDDDLTLEDDDLPDDIDQDSS